MRTGFEDLMGIRGLEMPDAGEVAIAGEDPVLSARFRLGEATAHVLAAIGVAITDVHEMKTNRRQNVAVDVRQAAATLRSSRLMQVPDSDGRWIPVQTPSMLHMWTITQPWLCKDGRWYLPHFNLPHLHDRVIGVLGCESNAGSVKRAVSRWNSCDLEDAVAAAGACGSIIRSNAEWLHHPQGKLLAECPIVRITKIGESDPMPFPEDGRPLSGIRVLDLTRILAGPVAARTLAENGADVLMVTAEHLPQVPEHVMDTSHGKRSVFLDLRDTDDLEVLKRLIPSADVFSQGYRPGALEQFGLGPEDLADQRPGIVYLSISCYGLGGPFSNRGGWEQVAQCATGISLANGDGRPRLLPASACDYVTGYSGAYGVLLALARRARTGGSYHVEVSLCRSGMYIHDQGQIEFPEPDMGLTKAELDEIMTETDAGFGMVRHLNPVLKLSETKPFWDKPSPVLGSGRPEWLPKLAQ